MYDKTYSVKQMCASDLLKLDKTIFGIKHITQIKRYAIRRQMKLCKHICSLFPPSNSNITSKIAMPVLLFLIVYIVHGHVNTQYSRTKYQSKIDKPKLNNVHILVFAEIMSVFA